MNGYERIRAALEGRWPDRRPVMLHNFMAAAREAGVKMAQFRRDPQALAQSFIQAVETYGYDGVVVDVDTATLAGAVGVPIDFPEDLPARSAAPLLSRIEEASDLPPADIRHYLGVQVWLEGTRRLVRYFGDEIFVRGNCDQAPFSLACCMRGIENWMLDIHDEACRGDVQRLLSYTTNVVGQFLTAMAETGAHMLSNGDSLAGPELISPGLFHELAWPAEQEIARLARQLGRPYALHVCGKANRILADLAATGAGAIELDQRTDVKQVRDVFGDRVTFIGNLDPSAVLYHGTPALVEQKTRELLTAFAGNPRLIVNAGCAIAAGTPPENLRALIHEVARFGTDA
ncbi:MAG: uroporphyrinogen decarboxylase family protein [Bryobacteraceae bacterium]